MVFSCCQFGNLLNFAQCVLLPVILGLRRAESGFVVSWKLERVYLSLMWVGFVCGKHPRGCYPWGVKRQRSVLAAAVLLSNAVGSWIPLRYKIILFKAVQLGGKKKVQNL